MEKETAAMSIAKWVLPVAVIGLAVCSYNGNLNAPIVLASVILGGMAAIAQFFSLRRPFGSLRFLVFLLVVLGGRVVQSRIPAMSDWEWWWMSFLAIALVAATTLFAPRLRNRNFQCEA